MTVLLNIWLLSILATAAGLPIPYPEYSYLDGDDQFLNIFEDSF